MQAYNEKQVQEMISEVDAAIETLLKSEKDALMKLQKAAPPPSTGSGEASFGLAESKKKATSGAGSVQSVPSSTEAANGGPLKKAAPDAGVSPVTEEGSAPSSEGSLAGGDPGQDPAGEPAPEPTADPAADQAPSEQELVEAYGQLSQPELELHAKALAQVMASQAGAGQPGAASPSAAGPGASPLPADQSPAVAPEAMAAMKSENALLRSQVQELQKGMTAFVDGFKDLMAPKQKAVTAMDVLAEPAKPALQLSKSEINEKLKTIVRRDDLTKAERKLITGWYSGTAGSQDLAHILSK